jgi:hypothetical protein
MTAAILQGVPATTIDTDLWIDLPERQYIRILKICLGLGASVVTNTVVALEDDSLVNFLYRVDGLAYPKKGAYRTAGFVTKTVEVNSDGQVEDRGFEYRW